uniref:Heterocycloanthracin/sonorensin family bacteriocin n=1 Tax=Parascaris univalens TaxID=6257 RepID=A0A915A8C9_PARUN
MGCHSSKAPLKHRYIQQRGIPIQQYGAVNHRQVYVQQPPQAVHVTRPQCYGGCGGGCYDCCGGCNPCGGCCYDSCCGFGGCYHDSCCWW